MVAPLWAKLAEDGVLVATLVAGTSGGVDFSVSRSSPELMAEDESAGGREL